MRGNLDIERLERDGFTIVADIISPSTLESLAHAIDAIAPGGSAIDRGGRVYASRNLLDEVPEVVKLARSPGVRSAVEAALAPDAFPVRALLFDKSPEVNWGVPWHQDLTVAVRQRTDSAGYQGWTRKAGVTHVQPPVSVLEGMVTVRVHLDADAPGRGPLRVIPGSHATGRLDASSTRRWLERVEPVECLVPPGGALVMRPLLLHASSSSEVTTPHRRRVIHLEFAAGDLPGGVEWYARPRSGRENRTVVS